MSTIPVIAHYGQKLRIYWKHIFDPKKDIDTIIETKDLKTHNKKFRAITVCQIINDDNILVFEGASFCKKGDVFVREVGRKRSLTNAISCLDRKNREKFWFAYFSRLQLPDEELYKILSTKSRRKKRSRI